MGRRKRISQAPKSSPLKGGRANSVGESGGACVRGVEERDGQGAPDQVRPAAGRCSRLHFWLLVAAVALEAAWIATLLVMVLRRW